MLCKHPPNQDFYQKKIVTLIILIRDTQNEIGLPEFLRMQILTGFHYLVSLLCFHIV